MLGTYVELHTKDVNVRTKDIKATILGTTSPKFLEYGYNFIERKFQSKGKTRTYKRFRSALNKLKDHLASYLKGAVSVILSMMTLF